MNSELTLRIIEELVQAKAASDGDGVKLLRVFGGGNLNHFDPFLMLDEFGSFEAGDYIGGFPSHPHRGFETVTYMLEGCMEHRDHLRNVGILKAGDVQWMKAASGVIHSEMPKQDRGRMRGFQLWVNLPAAEKMSAPEYQEISADNIPVYEVNGARIKAIAGNLVSAGKRLPGAIRNKTTEPGYLDLHFSDQGGSLEIGVPDGHRALLYVYEGEISVGSEQSKISRQKTARLSLQGNILLSTNSSADVLLITGKPISEPIVQYGPFVMNTREEIEQAISDFNTGRLTAQAD
jgi:quercetin 2,3-dioxygenase